MFFNKNAKMLKSFSVRRA